MQSAVYWETKREVFEVLIIEVPRVGHGSHMLHEKKYWKQMNNESIRISASFSIQSLSSLGAEASRKGFEASSSEIH